jgi:hypothetical protein
MSKTIVNPFQEIVNWLRSDEGQRWSEARLRKARFKYHIDGTDIYESSPVGYSATGGPLFLRGVLCVKED